MTSTERWRPALGYEGHYEVSDLGRVRRLSRVRRLHNGAVAAWPTKVLRAGTGRGGYQLVDLCVGGRRQTRPVHQLVCEAFHGSRPMNMVAAHTDGDHQNNAARNLRWATRESNEADKVRHGTWRGSYLLPLLRKQLKPLLNLQMEHVS